MAIPVTCACGQAYLLNDELAGKRVRCKRCNAVLAVPTSSSPTGSRAASSAAVPGPRPPVAAARPRPVQPPGQATSQPKRTAPDPPPPPVEAVIAEPAEEEKPRRKKKRKRSRAGRGGTLEDRMRRADEDDYDEGHPWRVLGFIGFAVLMAALAVYFYWDLSRFEEEGGTRRLNRIVWVAYQIGGMWGPVLLCGALSAASAVLAVLNLIGVRVAVDLSSDD